MEEERVLSGYYIRDAVSVVRDGTEAAARAHVIRPRAHIYQVQLGVGCLAGAEAPGFAQHLLQERRVYAQVLGYDVETKEVSVYAQTGHGVAVSFLMPLTRLIQ